MFHQYFKVLESDTRFYSSKLDLRLPKMLFDAHVHMNLPEHVANVDERMIKSDWALEHGRILPFDEAKDITCEMFPGREYRMLGFPWPLQQADIAANNDYLSRLVAKGSLDALMSTRPEWTAEYCEQALLNGGFLGFKPYPYMFSDIKDDEISIFDFITKEQLKILDKHRKSLLLHIPRKNRLADDDNIREIKDIIQSYPDITVVLAHFGRSFSVRQFNKGMKKLGRDTEQLYFDTAAVVDYDVYKAAFDNIDKNRIIYGSDMPIFMWHGWMSWQGDNAKLYAAEDFSWNEHIEGECKEKDYTFYMYKQISNLLDALDSSGADKKDVEDIFVNNALRAYKAG